MAVGGIVIAPATINADEAFPAKFDLRDRGVVTPVKLQNPWGSCWAFGALAAAETSILSDFGMTNAQYKEEYGHDFDLSEKHLTWFGERPITAYTNPGQAGEGIYYFDIGDVNYPYNGGGINALATNLFATGAGPVNETMFPYQGREGLTSLQYAIKYPEKVMNNAFNAMSYYVFQEPCDAAYKHLITLPHDENTKQWLYRLSSEGYFDPYPNPAAITREQFNDICYKKYLAIKREDEGNSYFAAQDDWTIPEVNEDGYPNRDIYSGLTLVDGNVLPEYAIKDNKGRWVDVDGESVEAIKSELMKGHGVTIGFHADQANPGQGIVENYINLNTWAHYTYDDTPFNHIVCIVGWDDNYSSENFRKGHQPPGNGAWIVKNSWGSETDWYDNGTGATINKASWGVEDGNGQHTGYFYISYYDKSIEDPETMTFDMDLSEIGGEMNVWAYDYMPTSVSGQFKDWKAMKTANTFKNDTDTDQHLYSVATKTANPDSNVEYSVYLIGDDTTNPEEGTLLGKKNATYKYRGFHREKLDGSIVIKPGERIAIVAEESFLYQDQKIYAVTVNIEDGKKRAEERNKTDYCVAVVNPGESYVYYAGEWFDWTEVGQDWVDEAEGKGRVVDNFSIKAYVIDEPDSLSDAEIEGVTDKTYTGKEQTQDPVVKLGGRTLKRDTDYTISYEHNVDVGTATMTLTGIGEYKDSKSVEFRILTANQAKNLKYARVFGVTDKTYTGKALKQTDISVNLGGKTLKSSKDYYISYKNNTGTGKATVTIKGKGKYKGKKSVSFKINKAGNPIKVKGKTAKVSIDSVSKKKKTLSVSKVIGITRKGKGKVKYKKVSGDARITMNSKGKVTIAKGTPEGEYAITANVTAAGNSNYSPATRTVTFKVKVTK